MRMKDKVETEVTKLSLDEALCVTSLGLKELIEGQGVKVEGQMYCLNQMERNLYLCH